jgi:hypothetical protein
MDLMLIDRMDSQAIQNEDTARQMETIRSLKQGEDLITIFKAAREGHGRDSMASFLVFINAASNPTYWPRLRELGVLELFIDVASARQSQSEEDVSTSAFVVCLANAIRIRKHPHGHTLLSV